MLRIADYARKSVYSDKSDSTQAQYNMATEYCKNHYTDFEIYRYEDEGYTGANTKRPAFNRMIDDIKDHKIDIVICYKIDRVSRDIKDFSNFFSFLQDNNVEFVSITESLDTSTPLGRAMMFICSIFGQMERETIAERVRDNMIQLSTSGKWAGGKAPLGYRSERVEISGKSHVVLRPDPDGIKLLNQISDAFLYSDYSLNRLEKHFRDNNIKTVAGKYFSSSQMWRILMNPTYCTADQAAYDYFESLGCKMAVARDRFDGSHAIMPYHRTQGGRHSKHTNAPVNEWIISVGLHDPLWTSEKFIAIQKKFGNNTMNKARKYKVGILKGVVKCSCGWTMRVKHKVDKIYHKTYDSYFCNQRNRRGKDYCSMRFTPVDTLDNAVIDILKQIKLDRTIIDNYCYDDNVKIARRSRTDVQRDISCIENKISNLTNNLSNASESTAAKYIISEIERLDRELSAYKYELMEISAAEKKLKHAQHSKELKYRTICHIVDSIDTADYDEINGLLKDLFKECIWDGETLHIKI